MPHTAAGRSGFERRNKLASDLHGLDRTGERDREGALDDVRASGLDPDTDVKRVYLAVAMQVPAVVGGIRVTLRHFFKKKVTMQYPEEKWTVSEGYRGAPYLVKDPEDHTKCVSCQLCEFICPPKAIRITPPGPAGAPEAGNVEKAPKEFKIDMLRCIFCGL